MDKIIIILIIYNIFTNIKASYSDDVSYLGPIVYSAEKPPILHFPAPEASNEAFILSSKPKRVKYVPLPRNELPVLIYQGEQPPIHVLQRNREKKNENYIFNPNDIPKPLANSRKPQGVYIPLPISHKSSSGNLVPTYGPPPFIYTGHPPIHIYEESNSQYGPPTYEKGTLDYLKDKGKEIQHGFESLLKDIHEKGKEFFDNPFNLRGKKQYSSYYAQQRPLYGPPKVNIPFSKFTHPTKSKLHPSKFTSYKAPLYSSKHFSTYGPPKVPYATYTYSEEFPLPGSSISGVYGKPTPMQGYKHHQYAPSYSDKQKYKLNPFETISNIFNNFKQQKSVIKDYSRYPSIGISNKPLPAYGPPPTSYPVKEYASDKGIKESFNAFLNSISNSKKQVLGSLSKGLQSNIISKPWKSQASIYRPPIPNFVPGVPLGPNDAKIIYNYPEKQISNQPPTYVQTFNNVPLIPPPPFLKPNYASPQYHQNIMPTKNGINIATQWKSSYTPQHGFDNNAKDYRTTSALKYKHPLQSEFNQLAYNSMKHDQYPLKPFPISSSTIDLSKSEVGYPGYILAPEAMKKPPIIIYQGYKPPVHVYESSAGINANTLSEPLGNNLGIPSSKHQDRDKSKNKENSNNMQYVSEYGVYPQMKISSTLEKNPIISSPDSSNKDRLEVNLSKTSLPPPYSPPVIYSNNRNNIWTPVSNRKHTTKAFDTAEKQRVAATLEIKSRT